MTLELDALAPMQECKINLDDDNLQLAAQILGTKTKLDTVNGALRAVVRQHHQRQMIERAARDGTYTAAPVGDDAWQ